MKTAESGGSRALTLSPKAGSDSFRRQARGRRSKYESKNSSQQFRSSTHKIHFRMFCQQTSIKLASVSHYGLSRSVPKVGYETKWDRGLQCEWNGNLVVEPRGVGVVARVSGFVRCIKCTFYEVRFLRKVHLQEYLFNSFLSSQPRRVSSIVSIVEFRFRLIQ